MESQQAGGTSSEALDQTFEVQEPTAKRQRLDDGTHVSVTENAVHDQTLHLENGTLLGVHPAPQLLSVAEGHNEHGQHNEAAQPQSQPQLQSGSHGAGEDHNFDVDVENVDVDDVGITALLEANAVSAATPASLFDAAAVAAAQHQGQQESHVAHSAEFADVALEETGRLRCKVCPQCHLEKLTTDFGKDDRNEDLLATKCKECKRGAHKQQLQPTVTEKVCKKCMILKYASEFCKSKWGSDGLHSRCKVCIRDALPITEIPTVDTKTCSKCQLVKGKEHFDRYKRTADGLQSQCKICMKAARTAVPVPTVTEKRCTKCRLVKLAQDYFRFKYSSDGLQSYCKACKNASRAKQAALAAANKKQGAEGDNDAAAVAAAEAQLAEIQRQAELQQAHFTEAFDAGAAEEWQQAVQSQQLDVTQHDEAMQQLPLPSEADGAAPGEECGFKSCAVCLQVRATSDYRDVQSSPDGFAIACRACEEEQHRAAREMAAAQIVLTEKACSRCHVVQLAENFYRNKHTTDRMESQCKSCKRSSLQNVTQPNVESKACSKCYETKVASQFDRYKRTADGLQSQCKECMKASRPVVKAPTVASKPCSKCHIEKPAKDFFRREQSHDGLQSWCRSCKNEARQAPDTRHEQMEGQLMLAEQAHGYHQDLALHDEMQNAELQAQHDAAAAAAYYHQQLQASGNGLELQPAYEDDQQALAHTQPSHHDLHAHEVQHSEALDHQSAAGDQYATLEVDQQQQAGGEQYHEQQQDEVGRGDEVGPPELHQQLPLEGLHQPFALEVDAA